MGMVHDHISSRQDDLRKEDTMYRERRVVLVSLYGEFVETAIVS